MSHALARLPILVLLLVPPLLLPPAAGAAPLVIAPRGASGYLPEHSLEAKVLAHAQGASHLGQEVVMTRDGELLVLPGLTLEDRSDVASRFPGRARADGRFYAIDFTLEELRSLRLTVPLRQTEQGPRARDPRRFPLWHGNFRLHTLAEEIELIQGLNATSGREVGLYVSILAPAFHRRSGRDIAVELLKVLKNYGYDRRDGKLFLETDDPGELRRLWEELLPARSMTIPLVWGWPGAAAGPGEPSSAAGMQGLKRYAEAVAAPLEAIILPASSPDNLIVTDLVHHAHSAGLEVFARGFSRDAPPPRWAADFAAQVRGFLERANVDGLFTDHPDAAIDALYEESFANY